MFCNHPNKVCYQFDLYPDLVTNQDES